MEVRTSSDFTVTTDLFRIRDLMVVPYYSGEF